MEAGSTAGETRERLVAAAAEVFAERGYEGAGVQEIARRAGLTTGAIYSRYSGKAELLFEAIRGAATPKLDELFAVDAGKDSASELIREAGEQLICRRPDPKQGLLLEAFVAARRDPEVAALMRDHLLQLRKLFARLIDFGQRREDIDPELDSRALVHFCQAVALGFLLYETVDVPQPPGDAWGELIGRLVAAMSIREETATGASQRSRGGARPKETETA